MRMTKVSIAVGVLIVLSLALAACSTDASPNSPAAPTTPGNLNAAIAPGLPVAEVAIVKSTSTVTKAAVLVSFDPNPVPAGFERNYGFWIYNITLTETGGAGVTFKNLVIQYYSSDGTLGRSTVYDTQKWFTSWLPNAYLPANGKVTTGAGLPVQTLKYGIFTYSGIDDNGNEIEATGRVDFIQ